MRLPSGGKPYADVTRRHGLECFTIQGRPHDFPYKLQIHYFRRGPMGYGMGKLEVIDHDGKGRLRFKQYPYVLMNDGAYLTLGQIWADFIE